MNISISKKISTLLYELQNLYFEEKKIIQFHSLKNLNDTFLTVYLKLSNNMNLTNLEQNMIKTDLNYAIFADSRPSLTVITELIEVKKNKQAKFDKFKNMVVAICDNTTNILSINVIIYLFIIFGEKVSKSQILKFLNAIINENIANLKVKLSVLEVYTASQHEIGSMNISGNILQDNRKQENGFFTHSDNVNQVSIQNFNQNDVEKNRNEKLTAKDLISIDLLKNMKKTIQKTQADLNCSLKFLSSKIFLSLRVDFSNYYAQNSKIDSETKIFIKKQNINEKLETVDHPLKKKKNTRSGRRKRMRNREIELKEIESIKECNKTNSVKEID